MKNTILFLTIAAIAAATVPAKTQPTLEAWEELPGEAIDVGVGANGSVWLIGTNNSPYMWIPDKWLQRGGKGVRIDVDPNGTPWLVNESGVIYSLFQNDWVQPSPGALALDVGIGANGTVFVVGRPADGYLSAGVFKWNPGRALPSNRTDSWIGFEFGGPAVPVRIDVDPLGMPWIVDANNGIFRYRTEYVNDPSRHREGFWQRIEGYASDIAIAPDGSVWVIGVGSDAGSIFNWIETESRWNQFQTPLHGSGTVASGISAGETLIRRLRSFVGPWIVSPAGIYRH